MCWLGETNIAVNANLLDKDDNDAGKRILKYERETGGGGREIGAGERRG